MKITRNEMKWKSYKANSSCVSCVTHCPSTAICDDDGG